ENRFIIMGESRQNRLLLVVHVEQEPEMIRIISARKPTRQERKDYEEG
ncbi:MAG: Ribonuclease toxin, BrnT, of type toxin-antitoxin system, partial [Blastocatellia bacterium]